MVFDKHKFFPNGEPVDKINLSVAECNKIIADTRLENPPSFITREDIFQFINNHSIAQVKQFIKFIFVYKFPNVKFSYQYISRKNDIKDILESYIDIIDEIDNNVKDYQNAPNLKNEKEISDDNVVIKLPTNEQISIIANVGHNIECENDIQLNKNRQIVEGMPVTLNSDFTVMLSGLSVYTGCAALLKECDRDHTFLSVAVGSVAAVKNGIAQLVFDIENINYPELQNNNRYYLMMFPNNEDTKKFFTCKAMCEKYIEREKPKYYLSRPCNIYYKQREVSTHRLCIDFGTSNTTAGTWGIRTKSDVELVKFRDVTLPAEDKNAMNNLFPTAVYVESCANDEPVYKFGYEARQAMLEHDYTPQASYFPEIKRWINIVNEDIIINDEQGNILNVKRRDIILAYILHVINQAEQYFQVKFKYLHFSAPVKQKDNFISFMEKYLSKSSYEVMRPERSLDEGVAIIYDYIKDKIKNDSNYDGDERSVLVLDCGGGTTDLASCHYNYRTILSNNDVVGTKLEIRTRFENGDSNFGGNKITYRILQMLKIKVAAHVLGEVEPDIQDLIPDSETAIMSALDNEKYSKINDIYKNIEEAYAKAEQIVPTKYEEVSFFVNEVKRNFYYLWEKAEAIKVEFYKSDSRVAVDFNDQNDTLCVPDKKEYYLYVQKGNEIKRVESPFNNIKITIKEINKLLIPDIYALLRKVLAKYDNVKDSENKLLHYGAYKLSGQSCRINLFKDLLKEFVPGRRLRGKTKLGSQEYDVKDAYKLPCIEGCIKYIKDKEFSNSVPILNPQPPKLIYDVLVKKDGSLEKILASDSTSSAKESDIDSIKISTKKMFVTSTTVELNIRDKNDNICREDIIIDFAEAKRIENLEKCKININDLSERVASGTYLKKEKIYEDIIKNIENAPLVSHGSDKALISVFAVPSIDGYGIYVYIVLIEENDKEGRDYYLMMKNFYAFENEELSSFFNGHR